MVVDEDNDLIAVFGMQAPTPALNSFTAQAGRRKGDKVGFADVREEGSNCLDCQELFAFLRQAAGQYRVPRRVAARRSCGKLWH